MTEILTSPASETSDPSTPDPAAEAADILREADEQLADVAKELGIRPLKGLSLWQPWASLIPWGKNIETRSWYTDYRGPVAILATKDLKPASREAVASNPTIAAVMEQRGVTIDDLPLGCIVAVADLDDCIEFEEGYDPGDPERYFGDFRAGRFGFILKNVRALPEPIPCSGAQGLFNLSDERAAEVWAVIEPAEESAPGPEVAAGPADAGVPPAYESGVYEHPTLGDPEPIGSRTLSYDQQGRHLAEIEEAERVVATREEQWEELKAETKSAKDSFDAAVERLRKVIRSNSPDDAPLFNQPVTTQDDTAAEPVAESAPPLEWAVNEDGDYNATLLFAENEPHFFEVVEEQHDDSPNVWGIYCGAEGFSEAETDFATLEAAKAACQTIADKLWAAQYPPAAADSPKPAAPVEIEFWRVVPLASLTPAIPPKKLQLLAENTPPITKMGELADWQGKGEPWWWKDIRGLGEGGMTAIVAAQDAYWTANPRRSEPWPIMPNPIQEAVSESETAVGGESPARKLAINLGKALTGNTYPSGAALAAEMKRVGDATFADDPGALAFSEDAIDFSTRQTVAVVEGVMQIDVARRTNGQWQRDYMVLLGKLDKSSPFGVSPQFATREEAARDAIDIIGGAIADFNGELKGKAAKLATKIRQALAEAIQAL